MASESITFTHISWVNFSDEDIRKVAEHVGVSESRVRNYLGNGDDHDPELFEAFHFITCVYPAGKRRGAPEPEPEEPNPYSMGCMVSHKR